MSINNIHIQNFTVFKDTKIDFCNGINVIIGQNGTGKTHLLKLLYAFCGVEKDYLVHFNNVFLLNNYYSQLVISTVLKPPLATNIFELINYSPLLKGIEPKTTDGTLRAFPADYELKKMREQHNDKIPKIELCSETNINQELIFIPAKEMLTHATTLLALDRERTIPFDKTLIDIIAKAELGESKNNSPLESILLEKIGTVIDGTVLYENDAFFLQKNSGETIPFAMEADGLKKFGLLWKLIRNGLIRQGTILFWDEPEANINPELMPILVDILLELQRNGVQIFVATHSYNLARYFDIKQENKDSVSFISLYKTEQGTKQEQTNKYMEFSNNSINNASETLYKDIVEKSAKEIYNE